MRWVEAVLTKKATNKVVMEFLEDKILTRFGIPTEITTDNAKLSVPRIVDILFQSWQCFVSFIKLLPTRKWIG